MKEWKIKYIGPVPGITLTQREMLAIIRDSWYEVGVHWHRTQRPKHFTRAGAREYGYAPRKGEPGNPHPKGFWASYMGRKQREAKHQRPLEYSGELKNLSRVRRILTSATGDKSRLRIQMPSARKANLRNPHSKIDMRAELTTVSEREAKEDVRLFSGRINTTFRRFTRRITR